MTLYGPSHITIAYSPPPYRPPYPYPYPYPEPAEDDTALLTDTAPEPLDSVENVVGASDVEVPSSASVAEVADVADTVDVEASERIECVYPPYPPHQVDEVEVAEESVLLPVLGPRLPGMVDDVEMPWPLEVGVLVVKLRLVVGMKVEDGWADDVWEPDRASVADVSEKLADTAPEVAEDETVLELRELGRVPELVVAFVWAVEVGVAVSDGPPDGIVVKGLAVLILQP